MKAKAFAFVIIALLATALASQTLGWRWDAAAPDAPPAVAPALDAVEPAAGARAATFVVASAPALFAAEAIRPICPWISEDPCPKFNDCGYRWDGICCNPRCRFSGCLAICIA